MASAVKDDIYFLLAFFVVCAVGALEADIALSSEASSTISVSRERRGLIDLEDHRDRGPLEASWNFEPASGHERMRRNDFLELAPVHLAIHGLSASQGCQGILLAWTQPELPYSPDTPFRNTEFSHYNVYRSTRYINTVSGLKPYSSGSVYAGLSSLLKSSWLDRDPSPNVAVWYAVTIVTLSGKEYKDVTPSKVTFTGAFDKVGARIPLTPNNIKGKSLNHAVTYNKQKDRYMIVYDVDTNNDNHPDRLFALQMTPDGKVVGGNVMDISANIKGIQGWPQVSYNPQTNEYLVVYIVKAPSMFGGKAILIGQRMKTQVTQRVTSPALLLKAENTQNGRKVFVDLSNHQVVFNSITGGYTIVAEINSLQRTKGIVLQSLNPQAASQHVQLVFPTGSNARNGRAYVDTLNKEIYVATLLPSQKIRNEKFTEPFTVIVTKFNATGKPLSKQTFVAAGTTNFVFTTLNGFSSESKDRLVLYWEALQRGKRLFRRAEVLIKGGNTIQGIPETDERQSVCTTAFGVRKPSLVELADNGAQALVWEEQQSMRWKIGGPFISEDAFGFQGNQQRNPIITYNPTNQRLLVVWQESLSPSQVNIIAQHIQATTPTCSGGCSGQEVCRYKNKCVASFRDKNVCRVRNGGCSHTCLKSYTTAICSCPVGMKISANKKTCTNTGPSVPIYNVIMASKGHIWQMTKYSNNDAAFNRLPISGSSIVAMGYDPVDKLMYYSDVNEREIKKCGLAGENCQLFLGSAAADGLTIDKDSRKLYFTDIAGKSVVVINLDGTGLKVLVAGASSKPRAVALYKENGKQYLYWSDWSVPAKVERAELRQGGSAIANRQTIVSSQLGWPNGIVVANGKLYVGDAQKDKIESFNPLGQSRATFSVEASHPYSMRFVNGR